MSAGRQVNLNLGDVTAILKKNPFWGLKLKQVFSLANVQLIYQQNPYALTSLFSHKLSKARNTCSRDSNWHFETHTLDYNNFRISTCILWTISKTKIIIFDKCMLIHKLSVFGNWEFGSFCRFRFRLKMPLFKVRFIYFFIKCFVRNTIKTKCYNPELSEPQWNESRITRAGKKNNFCTLHWHNI